MFLSKSVNMTLFYYQHQVKYIHKVFLPYHPKCKGQYYINNAEVVSMLSSNNGSVSLLLLLSVNK